MNFETLKCDACTATQHYSYNSGVCFNCQDDSTYDATSNTCIGSLTSNSCPKRFPYYNRYLQRCEACQKGYVYDR